jgi:hypothetical protein
VASGCNRLRRLHWQRPPRKKIMPNPIAVPNEKDLEDVDEEPEEEEPAEELEGDEPEDDGPEEDLLESWEADNEHTLYELYGGKDGDSVYVTDQEGDEETVLLASDVKELDEALIILSEIRDAMKHRAMLRRKGRLK